MLSKLSHIITSVPANGDSSEQELQRSPANTRREQARVRQHSLEESYTALRSASDDDSSIISARRPPLTPSRTGPSNVSWLSVPTDPKLTHSSSAPLIGRSASVTSPKQQAQRPAITNLQARSTHSLRSDYRRTSPIATTSPFVQHQTQLLSPIREQLSPERRPVGLPPISPLREVDVTDDVGGKINSPFLSSTPVDAHTPQHAARPRHPTTPLHSSSQGL
ncbi:hypothetical protein OE88DRAFT_1347132 [Heliocybe sulcata]|uniref:Uncharacterized protein n=1 Tax=Heliocybe sulcata TaxID=5364 RepID=A0A5C3N621_9AGAM|nr:hypothetical protein OE88DRAFT_1347132 [Heliocybe sulcata]